MKYPFSPDVAARMSGKKGLILSDSPFTLIVLSWKLSCFSEVLFPNSCYLCECFVKTIEIK